MIFKNLLVNILLKYIIFFLAFSSCQIKKEELPEKKLLEYISYRKSNGQKKDDLLKMVTGPLYSEIQNLTEVEFADFTNLKDSHLTNSRVLSVKKVGEETVYISFELSYEIFSDDRKISKSSLRKIAEMRKEENDWKVFNISNIKTIHEIDDVLNK